MSPPVMTERFEMRLTQSVIEELDAWRARQSDVPSRSEAVRRLMEQGLASGDEKRAVKLSDGEKLIIFMLCDMFKKLKPKSDIEPEFVKEVIYGGHYWAFGWKYPGIFHEHQDSTAVLNEAVKILYMWSSFLEDGYAKLSKKDKDRVEAEAAPLGRDVAFRGFDGNGEAEYIVIAHFMIEQLDRFTKFKGRDLDAHMPMIDAYRRMLAVFEPIQLTMTGRDLNADEIIQILKAMMHPSQRRA